MKTTKEMIAVMTAAEEGKTIQSKQNLAYDPLRQFDWLTNGAPKWNWEEFDYRVKPEPREWHVAIFPEGIISEGQGKPCNWSDHAVGWAKVCEVIKEP